MADAEPVRMLGRAVPGPCGDAFLSGDVISAENVPEPVAPGVAQDRAPIHSLPLPTVRPWPVAFTRRKNAVRTATSSNTTHDSFWRTETARKPRESGRRRRPATLRAQSAERGRRIRFAA